MRHFSRVFRQACGRSPNAYRRDLAARAGNRGG
ncbi:helix-turn-helix transcriptional regulator [Arthrobacter ginkgonis]